VTSSSTVRTDATPKSALELFVERLWLPGREGLARHVPCLNRLSGKAGCLMVLYLGPPASVTLACWLDSFGPKWCLYTQAVMIFGSFFLVDVLGLWNRARLKRRWGERAYGLAFLTLFLPGLLFGFIPGTIHVGTAPGVRVIPEAIGWPVGGVCLVLFALIARKVYWHFGMDRFFYVYTYYPEEGTLVDDDIFQFIRHPQYASFTFLTAGMGFVNGSLQAVILGLFVAMFGIGRIFPEEWELAQRLGKPYLSYRREVPALLPRLRRWPAFLKFLVR